MHLSYPPRPDIADPGADDAHPHAGPYICPTKSVGLRFQPRPMSPPALEACRQKHWNELEWPWLAEQRQSQSVAAFLVFDHKGRIAHGNLSRAAQAVAADYLKTFHDPFPEETDASYAACCVGKAGVTRRPPETAAECTACLELVTSRILSLFKRLSPSNARQGGKALAPIAPIASQPSRRKRPRKPSPFTIFRGDPEQCPARLPGEDVGPWMHRVGLAFQALPPERVELLQQEATLAHQATLAATVVAPDNDAAGPVEEPPASSPGAPPPAPLQDEGAAAVRQSQASLREFTRGLKAAALPQELKDRSAHYVAETDWANVIFTGGLDIRGNVDWEIVSSGKTPSGHNFIQFLEHRLKLEDGYIGTCWADFINVLFPDLSQPDLAPDPLATPLAASEEPEEQTGTMELAATESVDPPMQSVDAATEPFDAPEEYGFSWSPIPPRRSPPISPLGLPDKGCDILTASPPPASRTPSPPAPSTRPPSPFLAEEVGGGTTSPPAPPTPLQHDAPAAKTAHSAAKIAKSRGAAKTPQARLTSTAAITPTVPAPPQAPECVSQRAKKGSACQRGEDPLHAFFSDPVKVTEAEAQKAAQRKKKAATPKTQKA